MKILAIETSCDETAAAVVIEDGEGARVLSSKVASSSEMHEKYGGIVPEVAAREQIRSILPVIEASLDEAGSAIKEIDKIAVTTGPGLIGSLLVGVETAKTLGWMFGKPIVRVNHVAGHVFAAFVKEGKMDRVPTLPALALVVSGGHSEFFLVDGDKNLKWLGGTRDDAAGECFDKCARVMGLGYPGGPRIEEEAGKHQSKERRPLPLPMMDEGLMMSFSGLKSAVIREVEKGVGSDELAFAVNETICEILARKTERALGVNPVRSLILGGGVAANRRLRERLGQVTKERGIELYCPVMKLCTDNAAMIGAAALYQDETREEIRADPGWELF